MKTLTLLRHAKSGWDDLATRDFDRRLNAKGKRAARTIGNHARVQGLVFDHVIASPAARVTETLDAFRDGYGPALTPSWDRRVYLASAATLLDLVRGAPTPVEHLLMVGHNPGLEDLALLLIPDAAGDLLRDDLEEKFPTASLAELRFVVERWNEIAPNSATLIRFVRPRDLDPALGPEQD